MTLGAGAGADADELAQMSYDIGRGRGQLNDPAGAYQFFYEALLYSPHYAGGLGA